MQQLIENGGVWSVQLVDTVLYDIPLRIVGPNDGDALDIFRHHCGLESGDALASNGDPQAFLHDRRVNDRLASALEGTDALKTSLIYIHRGYQLNYRTPMLQSLLASLPKLGGVTSLRARASGMPHETSALLHACLCQFDHVLLINDRHERLARAGDRTGQACVEFALFRQDLDRVGHTTPVRPPPIMPIEVVSPTVPPIRRPSRGV